MSRNLSRVRRIRKAGKLAQGATKPKGRWHHGDLRSSLIAWGSHILDTEGTAAMSMRVAAKLAGVSQGAPAHHFENRNGFLAAIAAQGFREMVEIRKRRLAQTNPDDKDARLRAVMLGYVDFALKFPSRFHLMFGPDIERRDQYPELVAAIDESTGLLKSAVEPFLKSQAHKLHENEIAFAVWAATHGLATLAVHHYKRAKTESAHNKQPDPDLLIEAVVQFCLAALSGSSIELSSDAKA